VFKEVGLYSFCGSSVTYGVGVEPHQSYPSLLQGNKNYAGIGDSNLQIFLQALEALTDENQIIFVQWASPGRHMFQVTNKFRQFIKATCNIDHINKRDFDTFSTIYQILDTDFNQYYYLGKKFKILNDLSKKFKKEIYYINGVMHIDSIFFENSIPSNLSLINEITKSVIEFESQPDEVIIETIKEIQKIFCHAPLDQWVDINRIKHIDKGNDNMHMGPKSHKLLADKIKDFLNNRSICKLQEKSI